MKRILLVGLALCVCLTLVGCAATDPNNLFEVTTAATVDTTAATTGSTPADDSTEPSKQSENIDPIDYEALEEVYQYGNMQKGGGLMRFGKHVLFTFLSDGGNHLYTYDLTTGKVRLYCDDATCTHSNCLAGGILWGLEVYEGKVYTVSRDMQDVMNFQLTEITDTEKVPITSGPAYFAFHHDGDLYFKSSDSSLVVQEEGSDEVRVLIDEFVGMDAVIFQNYLYTNLFDNSFIRIDITAAEPKEEVLLTNVSGITDGQHIYYVDRVTNLLYRCGMDGAGAELLADQPVLPASINFDDEHFYFRLFTSEKGKYNEDSYDLYRFPKNDPTKVEKIATLPEPVFQVYTVPGTGKLFVTVYERSNGEQDDIYVMGTDGSNPTRLEIPEY